MCHSYKKKKQKKKQNSSSFRSTQPARTVYVCGIIYLFIYIFFGHTPSVHLHWEERSGAIHKSQHAGILELQGCFCFTLPNRWVCGGVWGGRLLSPPASASQNASIRVEINRPRPRNLFGCVWSCSPGADPSSQSPVGRRCGEGRGQILGVLPFNLGSGQVRSGQVSASVLGCLALL